MIKSDILNIFEIENCYSTQRYQVCISYLQMYEFYIIDSIFPAISIYLQNLPDIPSNQQHDLCNNIQVKDFFFKQYIFFQIQIYLKNISQIIYEYWDESILNKKKTLDKNINSILEINQKQSSLQFNCEKVRRLYSQKIQQKLSIQKQLKKKMIENHSIIMKKLAYKQYKIGQNIINSQIQNQKQTVQIIFDQIFIEQEHNIELEQLIYLLITIRMQDKYKFRSIIQSFIAVLSCDQIQTNTRMNSMKILRKISNFKQDLETNQSIQKDLISMGFLDFLCNIIIVEQDTQMKLEYIKCLIDFIEEGNKDIQESLYQYLLQDKENSFLVEINRYLQTNFNYFKEYVKSQKEKTKNMSFISNNSHQDVNSQFHFKKIIFVKLDICVKILELLRLSTENHYYPMQCFLKQQINEDGSIKNNNINMLLILTDIFGKYSLIIQDDNLQMGIKILDTLIEWIQGPCEQNQLFLCNTNLLENLEDLQYDINSRNKMSVFKTEFNQKIMLILRNLYDINQDPYIINKISLYIDPTLMIEKIAFNYKLYNEYMKKISNFHQGLRIFLANSEIKNNQDIIINNQNQFQSLCSEDEKLFLKNSTLYKPETIDFDLKNQNKNTSKTYNNAMLYEKANLIITEAFETYMLLKNQKFLDKSFKQKYNYSLEQLLNQNNSQEHEIRNALIFMQINTCSIEIVNQKNNLQKIYFRKHPITKYLSTITMNKFIQNVNREGSTEKINGLLSQKENFLNEMEQFLKLNALGLYFNLSYLALFRNINFTITLLINLTLLIEIFEYENNSQNIQNIFQLLNLIISIAVFIVWNIFQMPLEYKIIQNKFFKLKMDRQNIIIKILFISYEIILNTNSVYLLVYILFSLCGMIINKFFYSLLLLDIIQRSTVLQNVTKAITQNIIQLVMTVVLGIVVIYIYAMLAYFIPSIKDSLIYYGDDKTLPICKNAKDCLLIFLDMGLRNGGGIGDVFLYPSPEQGNDEYISRLFFDLSFFIFIIIILLNIIFGIIIDSFAELRDAKRFQDQDRKNKCFICNIERSEFENKGISFSKHQNKQHNVWNYLFYLIHLKIKNQSDYDGTETYVYEKYIQQDISWFPINQSLKL
ncbi:hypothetical protein IMG5_078330 [Ichthyophthirius multifiliis]|uniref:MIR domain protein n=1 Tax=Ichthyophthirius multifiliis TaxID=5932 RepID=G0QQG0_ICHMU|nr:hypothetical protein IMG5_078330 [Ichthyophthirius multifiliis]EGR32545.1 hypothetical protein IMG5_078330 [Ichthyophthirius multifiliis]|eukprot:XP_004036531.1 hypothetical protein IMG5_078330 [Ichthyophthirius multifiliis]